MGGYKILLNGTSRKLKLAELLKTTTTANPISDEYIQDQKEEKNRKGNEQPSQVCKNDT
jgi:hypothetical protein